MSGAGAPGARGLGTGPTHGASIAEQVPGEATIPGRRGVRPGLRLAVVVTRWNEAVVTALLEGALRAARDSGVQEVRVEAVEGALELPLAASLLARSSDAVVALGAVIEGETPHFEHVCRASVDGLMRVSLDANTPIGNGVLTCFSIEQAWARAGVPGSTEDKGYEATIAAIDLASLA